MPLSLSFLAVLLHSVQTHCNKLTSLSWFFLAFIVWQLSQTLVILIRFDHQHIKRIIKGVETMQQLMLSSIHNRTIKDWQISRWKLVFLSTGNIEVKGSSFTSLQHMRLQNFSDKKSRKSCQNYSLDIRINEGLVNHLCCP